MIQHCTDVEDRDLVERCLEGDASAYERVYRKYSTRILRYARRALHDEQHAEDVTQDVFLRLFRKLHTFRGEARFSTWLFRIAMNTCRNKRRSLARHQRLDLNRVAESRPASSTPDEAVSGREMGRSIHAALATLSREQRTLLGLRANTDLSYQEIGDVLGQSDSQIRGKLYRARKALRSALASA